MKLRKAYWPERPFSRVRYEVHRRVAGAPANVEAYDPPLPAKVPGKGYPVWVLEHRGRELWFASPEEMAYVADVLGRRVLPRPWQLAGRARGSANGHWLSRLHSSWRPWKVREQVVAVLSSPLSLGRGAGGEGD